MINIIKEMQKSTAQADKAYKEQTRKLERLAPFSYILIMPYCQQVQEEQGAGKWLPSPKDYPWWTDLIKSIKETYPQFGIVQTGRSGEQILPGVDIVRHDTHPNELKELLKDSLTFICGDTYLQHLATSIGKKGIVLWGQNNPKYFGYDMHDNLYVSSKYFRPMNEMWNVWNYVKRINESFVEPKIVVETLTKYVSPPIKYNDYPEIVNFIDKIKTAEEAKEIKKSVEEYKPVQLEENNWTAMNPDSDFARNLIELFINNNIRNVVEAGTYKGMGSTQMLGYCLKNYSKQPTTFHTIEINPEYFAEAQKNVVKIGIDDVVELHNGLTLPFGDLPSFGDIHEAATNFYKEIALNSRLHIDYPLEHCARMYYGETNYISLNLPDDLLGKYITPQTDLVLLDSAGHLGWREYQRVLQLITKPCFIVLDDIYHFKHYETFKDMVTHPDLFDVIAISNEKFGSAIVKYTPNKVVDKKVIQQTMDLVMDESEPITEAI